MAGRANLRGPGGLGCGCREIRRHRGVVDAACLGRPPRRPDASSSRLAARTRPDPSAVSWHVGRPCSGAPHVALPGSLVATADGREPATARPAKASRSPARGDRRAHRRSPPVSRPRRSQPVFAGAPEGLDARRPPPDARFSRHAPPTSLGGMLSSPLHPLPPRDVPSARDDGRGCPDGAAVRRMVGALGNGGTPDRQPPCAPQRVGTLRRNPAAAASAVRAAGHRRRARRLRAARAGASGAIPSGATRTSRAAAPPRGATSSTTSAAPRASLACALIVPRRVLRAEKRSGALRVRWPRRVRHTATAATSSSERVTDEPVRRPRRGRVIDLFRRGGRGDQLVDDEACGRPRCLDERVEDEVRQNRRTRVTWQKVGGTRRRWLRLRHR